MINSKNTENEERVIVEANAIIGELERQRNVAQKDLTDRAFEVAMLKLSLKKAMDEIKELIGAEAGEDKESTEA